MHVIAGNHEGVERRAEMRAMFSGDFRINGVESDYYAFTHNGARFVAACNAGIGGDHVGHLCSEAINPPGQCEWLEAQLAGPEATKFMFAHIPPAIDGKVGVYDMGRNDSLFLDDLFCRAKPAAAFFGHQHQPLRQHEVGVTRCFTLPSCAWNFDDQPLSFLMVKVEANRVDVNEVFTG